METQTQTGSPHYPKIPWTPIIFFLVALALGMGKWAVNDHVAEFKQYRQETRADLKEVRVEVQKNGKALARIEAILGK